MCLQTEEYVKYGSSAANIFRHNDTILTTSSMSWTFPMKNKSMG